MLYPSLKSEKIIGELREEDFSKFFIKFNKKTLQGPVCNPDSVVDH